MAQCGKQKKEGKCPDVNPGKEARSGQQCLLYEFVLAICAFWLQWTKAGICFQKNLCIKLDKDSHPKTAERIQQEDQDRKKDYLPGLRCQLLPGTK